MKRTWKYVGIALLLSGMLLCGYTVRSTIVHRLSVDIVNAAEEHLETEKTIFNDVWDQTTHSLRVTGTVSGGGIQTPDSPTVTGVWTFSPSTSLATAGVSTIIGSAQTITLTGANPTTYATIRGYLLNSPTLVGTNTNQTVTLGTTISVIGPILGSNVSAGTLAAMSVPTWDCGIASVCTALNLNVPTGAVTNYGVIITGGDSRSLYISSAGSTGTGLGMSNGSPGGKYYTIYSTGDGNTSGAGNLKIYDNSTFAARFLITSAGDIVYGADDDSSALTGGVLRGPNGAGNNIAGVVTTFQASRGTGSGTPGTLKFKASAAALGSGSTLQTAVDHMTIGGGAIVLNSAAVTPATTGLRFVCLDTAGKLQSGITCTGT